jgi:hypothetical protein
VGFPEAALPKYADKLVALGYKAGSVVAAHDSCAHSSCNSHSHPLASRRQPCPASGDLPKTTQNACAQM